MNIFIFLIFTFNTVLCTVTASRHSIQHHIPSINKLAEFRKITVNLKNNQFDKSIFSRFEFCTTIPCHTNIECRTNPFVPENCIFCVSLPGSQPQVRYCDDF
ncbi:hypothetical protein I7I50_12619 [Histoplasma capsulatum G186AR]|uniref:Uncharacterized protein n=1 Tax=Ajellomyces capsulatus TaxID=5037 RepID=A0A8H7YDF3_AJECA|nr:hypothetical protein I7I52_11076 [Histoplasma capsulatum]QSS70851.1 hypothetical protein I7I50_12619 [Histoplasma capsulatum G186AR]